jgi:hypothetical protein
LPNISLKISLVYKNQKLYRIAIYLVVLEDSKPFGRDVGVLDIPQLDFLEQGGISVKEGERGVAKFSALAQLIEQLCG